MSFRRSISKLGNEILQLKTKMRLSPVARVKPVLSQISCRSRRELSSAVIGTAPTLETSFAVPARKTGFLMLLRYAVRFPTNFVIESKIYDKIF